MQLHASNPLDVCEATANLPPEDLLQMQAAELLDRAKLIGSAIEEEVERITGTSREPELDRIVS